MPLPSTYAFDTETDAYTDGHPRGALIQICPIDAVGLDDVVLFEGWDCYEQWLDRWEETMYNSRCHMFNLHGYEEDWFIPLLCKRYEFIKTRGKMAPMTWTILAGDMNTWKIRICNRYGKTMTITDDSNMFDGSMESVAKSVKKSHPEWFVNVPMVKEKATYNDGWYRDRETYPEKHDRFVHYSKVDAFSQAMIARYMHEKRLDRFTTASAAGMAMALLIRYQNKALWDATPEDLRKARMKFADDYPPLNREMQDIVEHSLLGGYVYGETGTWHGTFSHIDYSSSYPYEYAYGSMFYGEVSRITSPKMMERMLKAPNLFRWKRVSFNFKLKPGMMPAISGKECTTEDNRMIGGWNKKMKEGRVENRLYTESYLDALSLHYDITDLELHELWVAKPMSGEFYRFIEECYSQKSREELKGTAERALWKKFMNGGVHGKTMTRTVRKERTYFNGVKEYHEVVNDPEYCSLIGFTGMMNSRERLLRDGYPVLMAGGHIMMCDTDSMIIDRDAEWVSEVLKDRLVHKVDTSDMTENEAKKALMENSLGRFEFEDDEDLCDELAEMGIIKEVSKTFDTFKCWGLKRYLEQTTVNGVAYYRKSAFAGMHDEKQRELLKDWKTDGTSYSWVQTGKMKDKYGRIVCDVQKTIKAENIWYEPMAVPAKSCRGDGLFMKKLSEARERAKKIQEEC